MPTEEVTIAVSVVVSVLFAVFLLYFFMSGPSSSSPEDPPANIVRVDDPVPYSYPIADDSESLLLPIADYEELVQ